MYHLCFSTFIDRLLLNKNNNLPSRNVFAIDFLCVFNDFFFGYSETSIGYFMSRSRNVSKTVIKQLRSEKMTNHKKDLEEFVQDNLSGDKEAIRESILTLIKYSNNIHEEDKQNLINIIEKDDTYNFLKEVFYYVVERTTNIKEDLGVKNIEELESKIFSTDNNATLERLCLVAFDMESVNCMYLCMEKMTNNAHIERVVSYIIDYNFGGSSDIELFVNKLISKMTNNLYISKIMRRVISKNSLTRDSKVAFINSHIKQFKNDKYLFDILTFMIDNGYIDEVLSNKELLSNETYIKKLNYIIDKTKKL